MPWSEEDKYALHTLNIPAEYVRGGCLTVEAYEKATGKDTDKKPQYMKKDELLSKATELGIEISDGANITRGDLLLLIEEKEKLNNATKSSELA